MRPSIASAALGPVSFSNAFIVSAVYSPTIAALIVASFMGLVRPSDLGVRSALIAETMPDDSWRPQCP